MPDPLTNTPTTNGRPPTHAGYARPVRDPHTAELRAGYVDLLVEDLGDEVSGPEAAAVGIAADTLVRLHSMNDFLDDKDIVDAEGVPLPAMRCYLGLVNSAGRAVERVATLAALRRSRGRKVQSLAEYLAARTTTDGAFPARADGSLSDDHHASATAARVEAIEPQGATADATDSPAGVAGETEE